MCIPLSLSGAQTQKTEGKAIGHQGSKAGAGEGIVPGADGQPLGELGANPHTFPRFCSPLPGLLYSLTKVPAPDSLSPLAVP